MASQYEKLHILMFPLMAQGHMIPMVDIAKLLAQRGAKITLVTTHANAARFEPGLSRARESGLRISLVSLRFPCEEVGLPEGHESLDTIRDPNLLTNFNRAIDLLREPAEKLALALEPRPSCVVSDAFIPWTLHIARALGVPRVSFNGGSCFFLLCMHNLAIFDVGSTMSSETEFFAIPGLPDRIEINKVQSPGSAGRNMEEVFASMVEAETGSHGILVNSFEELESEYTKRYKKERNGKVWSVGPASLCNEETVDKAQRGSDKPVAPEHECMKWLDEKEPSSVVYVCLGSLCNLITPQLVELALGLEASGKPFVWVIVGRSIDLPELEKWFEEDGFEERVEATGQGLLIRGWAPQVLILSHPSIGGFLTHCGWNSTLEGICAGLPLMTWPLFGDQFLNEKLVTQVLRIAVSVGVESQLTWGEEEKIGVQLGQERIKSGLARLMNSGDGESGARRARARELGEMAKRGVGEGGSSHYNVTLFLDEMIMQLGSGHQDEKNIVTLSL